MNNIFLNQSKGLRFSLHVLFWATYLIVYSALVNVNMEGVSFIELLLRTLVYFIFIDITATYFTLYFLMPKYLYTGKYLVFIVLFILSVIPIMLLNQAMNYYVYIPKFHPNYAYQRSFWEFQYFYNLISTYSVVLLAAAIKLSKRWYEIREQQVELEKQNLKSELAMLKLQLSPHFLFNTLNNIDSLIYSDKDKASESIIRLSQIMRYMLYESQGAKVQLNSEIEYLHSLVELQSLRIAKNNFIIFDLIGDASSIMISPLLFVPFIENAIKHGDKTVEAPGVKIKMEIKSKALSFSIWNAKNANSLSTDKDGGIGLINVKRRLELLYADKHTLNLMDNESEFIVELNLDLE